jgi:hypothetical protein
MARLYTLFQEHNHAQPFNSRNTHNKIFFPFGRTDNHPATPNFLIPVLSGMTIEPEILNVMALRQLPARLQVDQVAKLLGFSADDIAIVAGDPKLLKPLGSPAANAPKYYAAAEVLQKSVDLDWLDSASARIRRHHASKR